MPVSNLKFPKPSTFSPPSHASPLGAKRISLLNVPKPSGRESGRISHLPTLVLSSVVAFSKVIVKSRPNRPLSLDVNVVTVGSLRLECWLVIVHSEGAPKTASPTAAFKHVEVARRHSSIVPASFSLTWIKRKKMCKPGYIMTKKMSTYWHQY